MTSEIENIIDEIEEYLDSCKPKALSQDNIIVNRDEISSLIGELKAKTPDEIRQYQKIINNREAILADAHKKADQIIKDAEVQTTELVSEHQIMQQAYAQANEVVNLASKQAQEMVDKATIEANEIKTAAITYTDNLLTKVQEVLVKSIDSTKTMSDGYLNTMQSYLNTVISNRMELSPNPTETVINSAAPSTKPAQNSAIENLSKKNSSSASKPQNAPKNNDIELNESFFKKN